MEEEHHNEDKEEKHESEHKEENHHTEHKEGHVHHAYNKHVKVKKASMWMIISGVLAVLLVISIVTGGFGRGGISTGSTLSAQDAADKAVTYINTNLLQAGTSATLKDVEDSGNLYNVKLDIGGRDYDSYITKDGSLLFPSAVDLEAEVETPSEPTQPAEQTPETQKSDKPEVQLFVMSHCPFGTQAEKGMIPVVELLGDKIDFELKFVNYAMHAEKEVMEQLNQHCIKTEESDKLIPYLKCFLKEGDGEGCLTETGIDEAKLEACTEKVDAEFKITESLEDESTWSGGRFPPFLINDAECKEYGVRGSPSLVINDKVVSSARSPAAYLATICGAFNEAPEECEEELSTANPSSGFGYEETDNPGTGTC